MSKKSFFVCQECGYKTPKWSGKCPECGAWGSFVEETVTKSKNKRSSWISTTSHPIKLSEVEDTTEERIPSSLKEFDRVTGGGLVRGSVSLISGEPGIGKSTLLLQLSHLFSKNFKVLYVTAEESVKQVALRAKRLEINSENLLVLAENNLEEVKKQILSLNPLFVVFDSIQTLYLPHLESAPGSVSQVREGAAFITNLCKSKNITAFLVGHVTKEGTLAGPKVLEHIVDAVFSFEGDRGYNFRIFKSLKNRFGSTGEVAVFEMTDKGLKEIPNPSKFFLSERPKDKPGSAVFVNMEGERPLLLEVQALVTRAVFTTPQRRARGIDANRLSLIVAVLEKELGYQLRNFDVFVNIVGGIKVEEPGVDLPVAAAIVSSYLNRPIKENLALFGEVGLTGEIRKVRLEETREKEARKNGFKIPKGLKKVSQIPEILK